jgi:MFS family permease
MQLTQIAQKNTANSRLASRLTGIQWIVCAIASIGFAFDMYELLMMPLIIRPILNDIGHFKSGTEGFNFWVGILFYVPAVTGGAFGLLGGYLTDLLGRRRVLLWSILLYSISACAASFATTLPMLLFLRCTTWIGVCVEFVAGVAWVAELFSDPKQRECWLGFTQAAGGVGGLLVAGAYYLAVSYAEHFPTIAGGHQAWRYTLISGVIPALPLLAIRPFLPESPMWRKKQSEGTLAKPRLRNLFSPELRSTTLLTAIMVACSYAAAFGAIQHIPRIIVGLPGEANLPGILREQRVGGVQLIQELGHLVGRLVLAVLAVRLFGQRILLRLFQIPALILFPVLFFFVAIRDLRSVTVLVFFAALFIAGQFSFWGNYLPRVYPTYLRATGEAFATNVGGRMIGTSAAVLTTQLANRIPGSQSSVRLSYAAGTVALLVYAVGFIASFRLPEPRRDQLPE